MVAYPWLRGRVRPRTRGPSVAIHPWRAFVGRRLQPLLGRTMGAVFVGEAHFRFSPETEVEQLQVERFYESWTLSVDAQSLVFFFSGTTLAELEAPSTTGTQCWPRSSRRVGKRSKQ